MESAGRGSGWKRARNGVGDSGDRSDDGPSSEDDSDAQSAPSGVRDGSSPEKAGGPGPSDNFAAAIELSEYLNNKTCVTHADRGTVHVMSRGAKTACCRDPGEWPSRLQLSSDRVVNEFWPLCADKRCFGSLCYVADRLQMSRQRSGR